ncbi:hypothetical protein GCM10025768_06020 [Microbacterium pseudoresistens]
MLGREAHDLAASERGCRGIEAEGLRIERCRIRARQSWSERGRAVLEHGDVVTVGHLGGVRRGLRGEGVELGGRQEGAVLPCGGDRDPVAGEHVEAHGGRVGTGVERAGVDAALGGQGRARIVVVEQLAPVGEPRAPLHDAGAESLDAHPFTVVPRAAETDSAGSGMVDVHHQLQRIN